MIKGNQVSLNKFTLNISAPSETGINFNKGEILKGQVQEVKDNGLVSIFIKGKLIDALSEVLVNKGQQLFLMVDDMKDGKVVLKVLTPEMLGKIENANLSSTLKEIGLPTEQNHLLMAKKLIQHQLPVTADNIKSILRGVNLLGGSTPKNLEIVGLAMAKNVPINTATLSALAQFVEGKQNISSLTKELVALTKYMENASSSTRPVSVPVLSDNKLITVNNLAEQQPAKAASNNTLAAQLNKTDTLPLTGQNVMPDKNLSNPASLGITTTNEAILSTSTNTSSTSSNPINPSIFQLLNDLTDIITLPVTNSRPEQQVEELVQAMKTNLASEKELLKGLTLIKDIVQSQENLGLDKSFINTLISKLGEMEKEVVGQRLLNVMAKFSGDNNPDFYYLSFPVKVNEDYRLCQLKINKNKAKLALEDMDNIKFIVSLETGNLGLVLFHVEWHKNNTLKLQGVVETEQVCNHITTRVNDLVKALENKGYMVNYEGVKVAKTMDSMRLQLEEVSEVVKPFVIDIRI